MPAFPSYRAAARRHVRLRAAAERDIPEILIAYQDDPELHVRLGEDRPPSGAELGRRADGAPADRAAGTAPRADDPGARLGLCRGQLYVQNSTGITRRAELGIWLAPQARGRGLAVRSLRLAAGWLFTACGLERVELLTEPDNEA